MTEPLHVTELERCPACGWSIVLELANNRRRCSKCKHEWEGDKVIDHTPSLFMTKED